MSVSIVDQVKSAKRELALRQRVYPGWVRQGRMTESKAKEETDAMAAIVATLERQQMLAEVSEEILRHPSLPLTPGGVGSQGSEKPNQ